MDTSARLGYPHALMSPQQQQAGLVFAGLCAVNGAFVPAFAVLTTAKADALFVASASNLCAGLAALVVLGVRGELPLLVDRRKGPWLALIGLLGTAMAHLLFFLGAERSTAIETALCLQVEPVYSLIASRVFLGHPITRRRLFASLLTLSGIALAIGAYQAKLSYGALILLATPLCWQSSHVVVLRTLRGISPPALTGARYIYGGLLLAIFFCVRHLISPASEQLPRDGALPHLLPLLAFQGVVLAYVGTNLWYQAISRLDLARTTAIVVPSIPLLSFGASFLLLGEVATPVQWAGLALTAAGVLAYVTAPHAIHPGEHIPAPTAPLLSPDTER